jgi:hypothetical protein
MKCAQIRKYGGSDVVEITQNGSILNVPAEGKVLVAIKVAGVNPVDLKIREGYIIILSSVSLTMYSTCGESKVITTLLNYLSMVIALAIILGVPYEQMKS